MATCPGLLDWGFFLYATRGWLTKRTDALDYYSDPPCCFATGPKDRASGLCLYGQQIWRVQASDSFILARFNVFLFKRPILYVYCV